MAGRASIKTHHALLRFWHAWLAGSYLVAYVTAGEDMYFMHFFAGYSVLAAIATRILAGVLAPAPSPLRLPRLSIKAAVKWISNHKGRHPLFAWLAVTLLTVVGGAALTGALADGTTWFEDPHEVIAETSLWVIFAHVAFVTFKYSGKRLMNRVAAWFSDTRRSVQTWENTL